MPQDLIKFAFVGGEVSPNYYGRADLEKFDLALAQAENWFVDYHGGLSTSPGLEFVDFVQYDQWPTKFFTFKFSSSVSNTNVILFGKDYIRFIQDGAYVLEDPLTINSISKANPGVIGITAHGFINGDMFKFYSPGEMNELTGRTCIVGSTTANTFEILDQFGNNLDTTNFTTYVGGGFVGRVYTLTSPYDVDDLSILRCSQIRDVLRLTHAEYDTYNLIRNASSDWTLEIETFVNDLEIPTNVVATPFAASTLDKAYVITQVNIFGEESLPSDYAFCTDSTATGVVITWNSIEGAAYYNVYATRELLSTTVLSRGFQTGYLGQARGAHYVDSTGITPDFTKTPPQGQNPFADGSILAITVEAGGSGFTNASLITATDSNPEAEGFIGRVIVSIINGGTVGPISGIIIISGGKNYTNPTFNVTVGTGDRLTAVLSPISGNKPGVSTVHQQRQVYAASQNGPLVLTGSKPGQLSNFNVSDTLVANDSYEHEIDSEDVSPIRHLIPTRGGLLVFNAAGLWLMYGSSGSAITATNVQADPQSYKGASLVPPIKINTEVLYCEGTGGKIMLLSYNDIAKLYAGVDLSLLASHLISENKQIQNMCYADEPFKMVWAQREDGVMLNFTIIREQEVYAFSRRTTRGIFTDVVSLEEGSGSTVYVMVQRKINGRQTKFIEKVAKRNFTHVEDAFCVDCGLRLGFEAQIVDLQVEEVTGEGVVAWANLPIFVSGDVGKIIRAAGGKMRVATVVDPSNITVDIIRDITEIVPFTIPSYPKMAKAGFWTMDAEVTVINGLDHLEGETVAVLSDGNVVNNKVVTDGSITLPKAASRIIIGLAYSCTAQNLPLNIQNTVVEDKRKRVASIAMRVKDTRGLKAGNELDHLYDLKLRTDEAYGEPTRLKNGMVELPIEPIWSEDAQSYLVQNDPLPATILGYVLHVEVGDDKD